MRLKRKGAEKTAGELEGSRMAASRDHPSGSRIVFNVIVFLASIYFMPSSDDYHNPLWKLGRNAICTS